MDLPRRPPAPIPVLHPVPEYLADPDLLALYAETKAVLQVPWMGVVTMAFAHYRRFYEALWHGVRPLCASLPFASRCGELRSLVEDGVTALRPPPIAGRLAGLGYAPRELDQIRLVVETFSEGNSAYLAIATIARLLLEGGELAASDAVLQPAPRRIAMPPPLVLMEAHHADQPTRDVYADIRAALGLPFVNTDYRGLARWPSYFGLAWRDLRPSLGGAVHEGLAATVHRRVVAAAAAFPNPGGLTGAALRAAAAADGEGEAVLATVRLFQWLLPTLMVNVAFFREQLRAG